MGQLLPPKAGMSITNKIGKTKIIPQKGPKVSFIQKVLKGDTYLVMADSSVSIEDEFTNLYFTADSSSNLALMPPYEPRMLSKLVSLNNILSQCVEAMEVNIDATGYDFIHVEDGKDPDPKEVETLKNFFAEPYPGKSFQTQRRKMRRDLESTGFGFLEVLRNIGNDVVAMRNADSNPIRYVKLDAAVQVKKKVMRGGAEIELTLWERERRFCIKQGSKLVFYREFDTSRQIHKETGDWETDAVPIEAKDRGTELLPFNVNPDVSTPYGVPRWINQLPSVLGSRKAEEHNLEYFDAGGMPPALIFIQGGTLAADAADQLRNYLSGKNKNKNRAVVVEAQSSSGSLDSSGTVQVKVERFGAEMSKDSMYSLYDKNTEDHVRTGFRLPPLFVGKAADYNFATAVVAYMVAEAQVFLPERTEFDEIMNKTIVKALGIKNTKFKSRPITMKNATDQLAALTLSKDKVSGEDFIAELNKVVGTDLKFDKAAAAAAAASAEQTQANTQQMHDATVETMKNPLGSAAQEKSKPVPAKSKPTNVVDIKSKKITKAELLELARLYVGSQGLLALKEDLSLEQEEEVAATIETLGREELTQFQEMVGNYIFESGNPDLVNLLPCHH